MTKKNLVISFLVSMFYIDSCLCVIAIVNLPKKPLPNFLYPIQPSYYSPLLYDKDCWGIDDGYCWWYLYES